MRDPLIYVALYRFSSNIPNIMALNGCTWFVTQTNLTYFYVSCVGTEPLSFYLINGVLNFNVAFVLALVSLPLVVSIMSLYAVWTNTFNFYLSEKQLSLADCDISDIFTGLTHYFPVMAEGLAIFTWTAVYTL